MLIVTRRTGAAITMDSPSNGAQIQIVVLAGKRYQARFASDSPADMTILSEDLALRNSPN